MARKLKKPAPFRGQALCSSWQPGYHSVTKRLKSYGFAPPPFNGLAFGTIYVLLRNQYLSYLELRNNHLIKQYL
jgi:hypothetical protein